MVFWFGVVATAVWAAWQLTTSSSHAVTAANWWMLLGIGICGTAEWAGMGVIIASGILAMRVEKKEQVAEAGFES